VTKEHAVETDDPVSVIGEHLAKLPADQRLVVALAGPPAAGKSTVAAALVAALDAAVLVPMDGFHLDNSLLRARGLLAVKGRPETFDAAGFVAAMVRVRAGGEVILPVFDRLRDLSIAGVIEVRAEHRIVVVEGNYLAFDQAPWDQLGAIWDVSVFVDADPAELRRRIVKRWQDHGFDDAAALARAEENDLPNGDLVRRLRRPVDLMLQVSAT